MRWHFNRILSGKNEQQNLAKKMANTSKLEHVHSGRDVQNAWKCRQHREALETLRKVLICGTKAVGEL